MNHSRVVAPPKAFDIFGAVEELHNLSAKEMNKLLRDSQHLFTLRLRTGRGSSIRVDMERLVLSLPLHLLACLASTGAEPRLRYLLRGVRLLHSLSDLALRHPKLEQILLQEVKIREQVLDLIVYVLVTLASPEQEGRLKGSFTLLHAALVACSLHLLPAFVAAEWLDVVPVLLVHPKVDIFMDVAFDAVRRDIVLLQSKLRVLNSKLLSSKITATVAECMAQVIAQQCEASVQVLQSLCQPHAFRDKVLNHKELCRNGGLLRLALTVLKLHLPYFLAESKYMVSLISRLKSKILSMLVKFCETESVSFLDEVAVDVRSMHLAEIVAKEVLGLVRDALLEEPRDIHGSDDDEIPSGLLYIHAMRLADIFSDDSNFRNSVMDHIAPDLAKVLALSPTIFSSGWCGSSVVDDATKPGSDAVLIYDPFRAAGAAMQSFKSSVGSAARASGSSALLADDLSGCSLSAGQTQFASYSQERSSLFIKILANLHCFNPEICAADEKDRFLNLFIKCLVVGPFTPGNSAFFLSTVQTAVRVCENLFSLLDHVSSLPSEVVSDEDLQLVSTFYYALHEAICPSGFSDASMQEDPVVAYVKDAHEQKRKILLAQWQRSERWQRIQRLSEPSDKEQSNDGSSINKTTTKTSSSQPGIETDTRQLSEEAQSFGDRPVAKRKREGFGLEDETTQPKKRDSSQQPFEKDVTELEWMGEGAETNEVMDVAMGGGTFGNDMIAEAGMVEVTDTNNEHGQYNTETAAEYEVARILGIKLPDAFPVKIENEEVIQGKQDNFGKDKDDIHLNNCDNFNLGVKLEDVDIYEEAEVSKIQDFHCCMDFSKLEEINKETVLKFQDMSDEAEIMPVVETRQESSQSAVAEPAQGNVSERDTRVAGSSRIPKATAGAMCDELQPKKRKRNIMNEKQMAMMENALKTEPDMQRYPKLILQWTNQLNMIGPEISYQQLKNWLNNRKARLARQARETRGFEGEIQIGAYNHEVISSLEPAGQTRSAPGHSSTYSGSSNDPRGALSEDANTRDSDSPMQTSKPSVSTGISQCKPVTEDGGATNRNHMELDAYYNHSCEHPDIGLMAGPSHRSASVKFVKCEVGQYVSLLDKDGKEIAVGTVHQVEGVWQGKNIDEHGLCIVKISQLKVDKVLKLPHPSNFTGNTFEEAENMYGRMLVAWDTKRIFLIS